MKYNYLFLAALLLALFSCSNDQKIKREDLIREYFSGWVKKDWGLVAKNLDPAFTFTSPNGDDHLSIAAFKDKCWVQAAHIDHFDFIHFADTKTGAYVTYRLFTNDSASFRNTEYFDFSADKIKSIEVFFGVGEGAAGFPTNKN